MSSTWMKAWIHENKQHLIFVLFYFKTPTKISLLGLFRPQMVRMDTIGEQMFWRNIGMVPLRFLRRQRIPCPSNGRLCMQTYSQCLFFYKNVWQGVSPIWISLHNRCIDELFCCIDVCNVFYKFSMCIHREQAWVHHICGSNHIQVHENWRKWPAMFQYFIISTTSHKVIESVLGNINVPISIGSDCRLVQIFDRFRYLIGSDIWSVQNCYLRIFWYKRITTF